MKIKIDSRKIEKGDTFVALKGAVHDGHEYIKDAIEKGATTIIAEKGSYSVETILVEDTRDYLTKYLKENIYPLVADIKLIGVTGTNGKTTTCFLLYEALQALHKKSAYIGTIGFYMDSKVRDLNNTTPDLLDVYEMLLECKEQKIEYVALEVSSHALSYGRVEGLLFDYAVFTNLTRDHLDFHKTMENYALAKQKLFEQLKKGGKAIVNSDDPYYLYYVLEANKTLFYGFQNGDYTVTDYKINSDKNTFTIEYMGQKKEYESSLIGKYNIYNMLACIAVLNEIGFKETRQIVKNVQPPIGRMDKIRYNENTIIIDYAHTPDAVENMIVSAKEICEGKIYVIIGCGGNRDKTKRPHMARIATDLGDYAIFTSDNPRWEDPTSILEDMVKGLSNTNYEVIVNRKDAIQKGVQLLEKNDILLLLGKGHETYQIICGEKSYFDDKQVVLEFM
ncbi:MAG: UDP-N-acetylmuramoyl-L-alanyl-D-glutamate--2,6-diaminopimelate ligase [Bacilli bacterium]|nr:UDP-N-acetylmuramoyl-L-alanyl-D-glutamate--2,6-diaminopimelate ligase [Bacilli bacterium]